MQAELFDVDEFLVRTEPISDNARAEIDRATEDYRYMLETESLIEARARDYQRVHAPHVRAARRSLGVGEHDDASHCGAWMGLGGTLFGAGASGVISLLTDEPIPQLVLIACILLMLVGAATIAYAVGAGRNHRRKRLNGHPPPGRAETASSDRR